MLGINNYEALPGHKLELLDGQLNLQNDPTDAATESILFLGTATDGPINEPINVNPDNAYKIFGKVTFDNGVSNGATLLPAFEAAWQAGNRDIRLMRVSGTTATSKLAGASYTRVTEQITRNEFVAQGNDVVTFTLPHGGLIPGSLVVKAGGQTLMSDKYTADLGVREDNSTDPVVPADLASILLSQDVTSMNTEITVSYEYEVVEADASVSTYDVIENNTDSTGNPMIATGYDKTFTLTEIPKTGLKLYADGVELATGDFTVNAGAKELILKSTANVGLKAKIEASFRYDLSEVVSPEIKLESVFGGSVYNESTVKVEKDADNIVTVTITKPASKKSVMSEIPLILRSIDFPNFGLLVNAINSHPYNNVVRATVANEFATQESDSLLVAAQASFTGGTDELVLSPDTMFKRLGGETDSEGFITKHGAYQHLENYNVDFVIPLGVHVDDQLTGIHDNFGYQLALACAVMSHFNSVTVGVISASTPNSTTLLEIENHVKKLESLDTSFFMRDRFGEIIIDGEGKKFDIGQFIQMIAGPDLLIANTRLGVVASNTPATYTGFVSQLPVQSSPLNKTLKSAGGLRFEYSMPQLNRLAKARFVTYKIKPDGSVGIVDAMTAASAGSDYTRVTTARVVKEAINQVRDVADPFLGEPNDIANRNALASALDKRLGKMVEAKALLRYDFRIVATEQMEFMGEAQIELKLRAPNELRDLTTIAGLTS